jgi:uroporphyrinogen III methyltransferase/synthase
VFARGGEEARALRDAGVPFEVVPGVTSAVGAPAYAGIPLTHRGLATSFTVVTGHEDPWAAVDTDWEAVARMGGTGTIVVLMGVATRAAIAERLLAGGLAATTPVAAVTWGTRPEQRTVRTTLGELGTVALDPPAAIVIGAVAALDLAWFEDRPLFGRRVVVTRARQQAGELVERLRALGAETVELPVVAVAEPADGGAAVRAAAARLRDYDWVAFTSANGAERFCADLADARAFGAAQVAAVGPATAAALAAFGVRADLVLDAGEAVAESLVAAFPAGPGRVLLPQAAGARPVLAEGLRAKGWEVDTVEAYRTVAAGPPPPEVLAAARAADAVTFTSSSTVRHALDVLGLEHVPPVVACIGPVTAATAREHGLEVAVVAADHTAAGLARALADGWPAGG